MNGASVAGESSTELFESIESRLSSAGGVGATGSRIDPRVGTVLNLGGAARAGASVRGGLFTTSGAVAATKVFARGLAGAEAHPESCNKSSAQILIERSCKLERKPHIKLRDMIEE